MTPSMIVVTIDPIISQSEGRPSAENDEKPMSIAIPYMLFSAVRARST